MQWIIKLLIDEEGIRSTPSIYISILLAYLENQNWKDASYTLNAFKSLEMQPEEEMAFLYLQDIITRQDTEMLEGLLCYLKA